MMNSTNPQTPREPEIGEFVRGVGTLIAIQDRTPPPPPVPTKDHIFEEITARTELWLGDERIKEFSTLNDFYGLETSVTTAIKEAGEYAAKREIGPESELEVRVVRIASQCRKHPKSRENFYDKRFMEFEAPSTGCHWDLPDDVETIAWTSRQALSVLNGTRFEAVVEASEPVGSRNLSEKGTKSSDASSVSFPNPSPSSLEQKQ